MPQTREQRRASHVGEEVLNKAKNRGTISELGKLQDLLANHDIDLADLGSVKQIRVNDWTALAKGEMKKETDPATGKTRAFRDKTEKVDLHSTSIVLSPAWDTGPRWPVVQSAKPVAIKVPERSRPLLMRGYRTALVEPDPQFGFIRAVDGTLHPIHDPRAIDVSEQIAESERPHNWINLGDYLDLAEMSTFRQEPGFAMTTQPTIDEGHRHAAVMRSLASDECWVHEGNHDQRMMNYILDNARAAFGLRRAHPTSNWPVFSLPYLLRFDELKVDYVDGYPATWRYINEGLATTHGTFTGPDFLRKIAESEQVSVIAGHDHSAGTYYKTRNTRTHKVTTFAHSAGTLARTDGFVPGGGKYRGRKVDGMPARSWNDWQQGITIARYIPGDGPYEIEHIVIDEGVAVHRGQKFVSKIKLAKL